MKIKSGYILKKVMGSYMVISESNLDGTNAMQTVNETGAFLWSLMKEDTTVSDMTQAMIKEYDIDEETAKSDIEAFVLKLSKSGILEK